MKKLLFTGIICWMLLQSSCFSSLQPIVTYDKAVTDDRITGNWQSDDQDFKVEKLPQSWFYQQLKGSDKTNNSKKNSEPLSGKDKNDSILYAKSYIITYKKQNIQYLLYGSMIDIEGQRFINFTSVSAAEMNNSISLTDVELKNRQNTYTIARIFINNNSIRLDFLNADFIYDQVTDGRMKIKHEKDELFNTFLITASTQELRQFLSKYGKDSRFYDKKNSVNLTRKS